MLQTQVVTTECSPPKPQSSISSTPLSCHGIMAYLVHEERAEGVIKVLLVHDIRGVAQLRVSLSARSVVVAIAPTGSEKRMD